MFFSFDILVKKNGRFALVWQYIHDKKRISRARERDLLAIDVSESCTELRNYMPSGKYSSTETKQKMSLYLLSQLFYGIVLLHSLQTTAYLDNLQLFAKSLLRVSASESKAKRKRSVAIQDEGDDAESTSSKRRRTPRPEVPTMMDLTQPKSYMREHTPVPHLVDPLVGEGIEDDNFEVKGSFHGTLLDWDMNDVGVRRMSRKVSIANIDMFGGEENGKRQPRVSISDMDYLASPEALRRPTGQFDISNLSMVEQVIRSQPPSPMQEIPRNLHETLSPRLSLLSERVAAQRMMQQLFSGGTNRQLRDDEEEEDEEEDVEFILEPLAKKTPTRRAKTTKRGHQYHDARIAMNEAEIAKQSENTGRLERPKDRTFQDIKRSRRDAYFSRLTNPIPSHLQEIRFAGLNPIFETVLHGAKEVPLTFRQASRVDYDEMRRHRRLAFEIVSWNSEGGGVHDAYTPGMPMEQSKNGRVVHGRSLTPSVIVPESVKQVRAPSFTMEETPIAMKPSSISVDQRRMSSFERARRASTPVVLGEASGIAYNELRETPMIEDDLGLANYPAYQERDEEINPMAQQLLHLIDEALARTTNGVTQFSDVVVRTLPRAERARSFLALLSLLKRREIKAKQLESFGSIFIKRHQPQKDEPEEQEEESSSVVGDRGGQDHMPGVIEG